MKSARDPRHQKRREVIKELFAESFASQSISAMAQQIYEHRDDLDQKITSAAPQWPIDKLNKIDLAILRLAIFELDVNEAPPKVVIDEAVELAKEYGAESSPSFVNGVLGTVLKRKEDKQANA